RPFQLQRAREALRKRRGHERRVVFPSSQAAQARCIRAQALGEAGRRQGGQVAQRPQAPTAKGFFAVGIEREQRQGERSQRCRLFTRSQDGESFLALGDQ